VPIRKLWVPNLISVDKGSASEHFIQNAHAQVATAQAKAPEAWQVFKDSRLLWFVYGCLNQIRVWDLLLCTFIQRVDI